ncbi:MAG: glycosyltransferase family 4 protein [Phycisphaeraceae bacterium]|nr:glycosyltransferase family 4 protein [Phycisphaeraceae bacterium]
MRVLYLTINRKLFGTTRILRDWLTLGRACGIDGCVATVADDDLATWCRENNVPVRCGPLPWISKANPIPGLWHAWRVAAFARKHHVDLIHCNEHNCHPFATQVQRHYPVPIVCHVRFKLERGFVEWGMTGSKRPAAVLWTSTQQKEDSLPATRDLLPEDLQHVVSLGLDLEKFGNMTQSRATLRTQWGFSDEDVVIGYATVPQPRKRLFDFVEAVAELAKRDPRVCGVLAGHVYPQWEKHRDEVIARIAATGMGKRFQWLGRLDPVEPFDHAIDICMHTSEYETFGMSVLEAMACRRPVVAYRGGSVGEVVDDGGVIVENGDVSGLIEAALPLVRDPARRAEMGERGRRRVAEHFSPRRAVRQLADIYQSVKGKS